MNKNPKNRERKTIMKKKKRKKDKDKDSMEDQINLQRKKNLT